LPATGVTAGAVRSYRTFSPLPFDSPLRGSLKASPRLNYAPSNGPALSEPRRGESKGGIFSVPLVRQVALPGNYPAHCPLELGLSSRLRPSGSGGQAHRNPGAKASDRL